jgi:hypothetical protein
MNLKSLFESPWFKGTEALLAIAASGCAVVALFQSVGHQSHQPDSTGRNSCRRPAGIVDAAQQVIREQLDRFYSPLLGIRERLRANGETRLKVSAAAEAAWRNLCSRVEGSDPVSRADAFLKLEKERFPGFEKIIEYNNRQLAEEVVPLYRRMVEIFTGNMWLAEPSTR